MRIGETRTVSQERLRDRTWTFHRRGDISLAERLTQGHPRLHERTSRISAGIATGYNPAFVLDARTAAGLESELIHRTLRGRDVRAYGIADRDEFLLVPYSWDEQGRPELVDLADFPRTRSWLQRHKSRLHQRHCVRRWGKAWWDLHDPVGVPLHTPEIIVVPDLARSNRFALDKGFRVPQHSAYYLIPDGVPAAVLTGILNTPAIEFLVRSNAPLAKDGFSRYRRQFLVDLPVPDVDPDTEAALLTAMRNFSRWMRPVGVKRPLLRPARLVG